MSRLVCQTALLVAIVGLSVGCKKSDRARNNDDSGGSTPSVVPAPAPGKSGPDLKPRTAPPPGQFANLYAETSEKTLAADEAPPSAPLRARKADSFYKLSRPRIEPRKQTFPPPPPGSGPLLVIDYERTQERAIDGNVTIVIRTAGGKDYEVHLNSLQNRGGQIQLEVPRRGPWTGGTLPKDAEIYLTRGEDRYGKDFHKTFKVSNSVLMGDTNFPPTRARDWTAEEAAKLATRPVEAPKPNVNPNVGRDTALAGTTNAFRQRFAEADRPLIGFDWYEWFWPVPGGKEECLGQVVPIYDRAYPEMGRKRALAKPGYAVGAITAKTKTFVSGIQITFMKLTADGKLDPTDSYTTDWLGPHQVGTKETKLGGDGRRVLGLVCDQVGEGAALGYLSAIGLVMEAK